MGKWCDISSALWYMRVCLAQEVPLTVLIHRYSLPIFHSVLCLKPKKQVSVGLICAQLHSCSAYSK